MIFMFSCFAEDPGEGYLQARLSDGLFAVNQASTRAKASVRATKLPR